MLADVTALEQARQRLDQERDRRARAQASIEREPPSPITPAHGWLGPTPATAGIERPAADMTQARARLAHERARTARAAEPRVRPPAGVTYRPTPNQREHDLLGATPGAVTMIKIWDLSPIDPQSFDPFEPPSEYPPPPTNTAPPTIALFDGLIVGDGCAAQQGNWTGSPSYARQWLRAGAPIAGETSPGYTFATADIGLMIGCVITATNAGGSTTASAEPVGPVIEPAPPLAKRAQAPR